MNDPICFPHSDDFTGLRVMLGAYCVCVRVWRGVCLVDALIRAIVHAWALSLLAAALFGAGVAVGAVWL